jgi:PAS domain S-box-containing protein
MTETGAAVSKFFLKVKCIVGISRFKEKKIMIKYIFFNHVWRFSMHSPYIDNYSFFEQIYKFAPMGIALMSIDGTLMNVNPALCKLLGYSKEELIDVTLEEVTSPDDFGANVGHIERLLRGESSSFEMDKRYIHKNGEAIWSSLHVSLVRDEVSGIPLYFIGHVIDISEKKAVLELYKLISENAWEIIYCTTINGNCYYCSPSVQELLGYRPEELVGKRNLEIIHPDDVEQLQSREFSDQEVLRYRNRHKNGHYIWLETTFTLFHDDHGEQKVLAIARDITERKKNEDILSEAQRIASIGSWEWDIGTNEVSFSDQVYRICNIDKNKKMKHPLEILDFVHPGDQRFIQENITQALKKTEFSMEFRNLPGDGSTRYLHLRGIVSFDDHGSPIKMNGTIQDVTEQKETELTLQETAERYTSLKKYNHDAIISLDLQGNMVHGNTMAEKMTGYTISELAGASISMLIGADHLNNILSNSINDRSVENSIDKIKNRDGHFVEVLTTIAPIIINNKNVGYYIIAKDITEQKKLLIAKEAAENTNKSKSEFLAMMSHEIRTPMNGVIGMTDLLSETTHLDADQQEYVEIIRKSGETLLTIINEILDFSKIDSGKTLLIEEPFDVRNCVAETFDVLYSKANAKCLHMTHSVSTDVPDTLIGDSDRLKQVLMNIIGNAIKFTSTGGVSVSVKTVTRKDNNGIQLKFVIKDSGIGISPDKTGRLFEPFYQLDNFMTRKYEGTGLGLAISKKLVELMGGTIWVEPTAGTGATFAFTVCLKEDVRSHGSTQERMSQDVEATHASLKILIAEDNEINQQVLKRMLDKLGHSIEIAENGNEVIQKAMREKCDIIFMDINMPVMNGLQATKVIHKTLPPDQCPVIVAVTANALKGDREKCLAIGMDDYLSKPIKIERVSEIIHKFFGNRIHPI